MAQCPVCQAAISEDFGLVECASCGAQLLIHVDGTVEHAKSGGVSDAVGGEPPADEAHVHLSASAAHIPNALADALMDDVDAAFTNAMAADDEPPPEDEPSENSIAPVTNLEALFGESQAGQDESSEVNEEPPPTEMPEAGGAAAAAEYELFEDAAPTGDAAPSADAPVEESAYRPPGANDSPDLSDIAKFGNSEASSHREGSLRYNLRVTGIDTADIREAFREAITDRKLMWDTEQILRTIRNGEVEIASVAATKAHVVITRLRSLPVRVSWEQYAIQQS